MKYLERGQDLTGKDCVSLKNQYRGGPLRREF